MRSPALGRDVSGGLLWAPSVIQRSAEYGNHLSVDNRIIETAPGEVPQGVELKRPLTPDQLATLRRVSTDEMVARLTRPDDLQWCARPFLDSTLPGGGAELATVVGYGMTEHRFQQPRLADPHGMTLAWLRCGRGTGVNRHRMAESEVVIVKDGRLRVTLNREDPVSVELGPYDTLSIPPGAWRQFENVGDETSLAVLLTGGESRVYLEWDPSVVTSAREQDVVVDPNGYLASASMLYA